MGWLDRLGGFAIVLGILLVVLQSLPGESFYQFRSIFNLWWLFVAGGGAAVLHSRGVLANLYGSRSVALDSSGTATADSPIDRKDIITATNWKRENSVIFKRSLGISLAAAGFIALVVTVVVGIGGRGPGGGTLSFALAGVWGLLLFVGLLIYFSVRSTARLIERDYTHRVSVRVPDLFALHSFHVHLRQIAEDMGYVASANTSPGKGGSHAAFDEGVFLTKGGFEARKQPVVSTLSPFPEDSVLSNFVNLTSLSLAGIMIGISVAVSMPNVATVVVGVVLSVVGAVALLYDYVKRTRNWAELYCLEEGTVYTSTANVHDDTALAVDGHHVEPTVSSTESSTEIVVTVGASCSPYFDESTLAEDFKSFVEQLDDVATENSYTIVEQSATQ